MMPPLSASNQFRPERQEVHLRATLGILLCDILKIYMSHRRRRVLIVVWIGSEFFLACNSKFEMVLGQKIRQILHRHPMPQSVKCLNLMEIRFNNLPTLRSVQQYRFDDTFIKIGLGSYAVDRWPPYRSKISRGIPGFAKSVLRVFLCTPTFTYHTSEQ